MRRKKQPVAQSRHPELSSRSSVLTYSCSFLISNDSYLYPYSMTGADAYKNPPPASKVDRPPEVRRRFATQRRSVVRARRGARNAFQLSGVCGCNPNAKPGVSLAVSSLLVLSDKPCSLSHYCSKKPQKRS